MRKIFFGSATLFTITLVFWGVYFFAFRTKENGNESQSQFSIGAALERVGVRNENNLEIGKPVRLSEDPSIGLTIGRNGNEAWYFSSENGTLYAASFDGKNRRAIDQGGYVGIESVTWAPSKSLAVFQKSDSRFYVYDYHSGSVTELTGLIDVAAWMEKGERLITKRFDEKTNERYLSLSSAQGTDEKRIESIPFRRVLISVVPESSLISYWEYPSFERDSSLFTVNSVAGVRNTLVAGKRGSSYVWSPSGNRLLMSHTDEAGSKMNLVVMERDGTRQYDLGIPTFVEKTAWSKDEIMLYYALPAGFPEGTRLPDDYLGGNVRSTDTLWMVDVQNGKRKRLVELTDITEPIDATDFSLSKDGSVLVFRNAYNNFPYAVRVK